MKKTLLFSLIVFIQFSILSQSSFNGYALYNGKNPNQNTVYLIDKDGTLGVEFGAFGVPETFLIDRNKKIIKKFIGPIDQEAVNKIKLMIK